MCMLKGETNEIVWGGKKKNTHETSYHAAYKEIEPAALKRTRKQGKSDHKGFLGGLYLSFLFPPSATTHITEKFHWH